MSKSFPIEHGTNRMKFRQVENGNVGDLFWNGGEIVYTSLDDIWGDKHGNRSLWQQLGERIK